MINLLPDETKQSIRAARTNTLLLRYIAFIGLAAAFLALALAISYIQLNYVKTIAENAVTSFISKNSSYSPISSKADKLKLDLITAKSILDNQISYSAILTGIANSLPVGTILESPLTIDNGTIGSPMNLIVNSKLSTDETKLKENFSKSPLFSDYKLNSVTNSTNSSSEYPVIISFSITIKKAIAL